MPENPKRTANRLAKLIEAWETHRATKSFAGMTLDQFKQRVGPSLVTREQINLLLNQAVHTRAERRQNDAASIKLAAFVVNAVKGDPEEGEDGPLYAAMGFVPKSARKSGLARRASSKAAGGATTT